MRRLGLLAARYRVALDEAAAAVPTCLHVVNLLLEVRRHIGEVLGNKVRVSVVVERRSAEALRRVAYAFHTYFIFCILVWLIHFES